jgi:cell division septation protein DedD
MHKILITLSALAHGAFVFENNNLNHLDIEFSSSHSILDRVARDFDDESSGDDQMEPRLVKTLVPSDIPKTVATSSDITAIQEVVVTEILQDSTTKAVNSSTPAPVGDDVTTPAGNTTTPAPSTPAPEPEPESSALAMFGWTTSLLLATLTALLL